MLPASTPNPYTNMKYNIESNNLLINGNISTSKTSSVSTLTSPSVASKHYKLCSVFSPINEKIQYSDFSKTQSRYVRRSSGVMKSKIKSLSHKYCRSIILEYFLKYKDMKEVVSTMDKIITSSIQEITRQILCKMRF